MFNGPISGVPGTHSTWGTVNSFASDELDVTRAFVGDPYDQLWEVAATGVGWKETQCAFL